MRGLVLLSIVFLVATGCSGGCSRGISPMKPPGAPSPSFELLRGGGGMPYSNTKLDQLFSNEMVGNWFALHGDGTTAGPIALTTVGSPVVVNTPMCLNGSDCATTPNIRTSGPNVTADGYTTPNKASPTGDFSIGWFGRVDDTNPVSAVFTKLDVDGNANIIAARITSGSYFGLAVASATSQVECAPSGVVTSGTNHFIVATYRFVAEGTSVTKIYVDGTLKVTCSAMPGPPKVASTPFRFLRWFPGSPSWSMAGNTYEAFYTEKELPATTVTAMTNAAIPSLQGTRGEAVTNLRTTVRECCNATSCAMIPANKTCVRDGALDVWPTRNNFVFPSDDLSTQWSADANVTVTPNVYQSPRGAVTLEKIVKSGAANTAKVYESMGSVTAGTPVMVSAWVRADTGTAVEGVAIMCAGVPTGCSCLTNDGTPCSANVVGTNNCEAHATVGTTLTRLAVGVTSCGTTGTTYAAVMPGVFFTDTSGTGGFGRVQAETGASFPGPYCPTSGAPASCNADRVTVPNPLTEPNQDFCLAATITVPANPTILGGYPTIIDIGVHDSANSATFMLKSNTGQPYIYIFTAAGAYKAYLSNNPVPANTPTRLMACTENGNLMIYRNGVPDPGSPSSAGGTGKIPTPPANLTIGNGGDGSLPYTGTITDICVGKPGTCK